ncbi:hypothetical protein MMAD_06460 [Mycolicibacterium madagascariense]|uniref:Uncharacterized protein n=1 Tax=Mycolicibacterium madagascariense TaxID=212765 RepID=A0A7I7XCK3_9MYCO|nr:hypothetical protein [Mycolicibacterium madagascariense]MCV7011797.1 hypothetical protein [Mycolicibacterium madagascariense]BBZ26351.1 hypothetical protein MMAD_06460 [Mycolicibacterium madagascariense]
MGWFTRRKATPGRFRVTAVTEMPSRGTMVLNGVPVRKYFVSGLLDAEGVAPQAVSYELRAGLDRTPAVGEVLAADIDEVGPPAKATVHWGTPDDHRLQAAAQGASEAEVLAELMRSGRATHAPGEADPLGIAATDPAVADTLAQQLGAALGTPISLDVDLDGVRKTVHAGGGGHLTSAEAAELLRTGIPATAVITGASRVPLPAAMLPGSEASLWDLELRVRRSDGTSFHASNRTAYRTEARRNALGAVGLTIPVRIDPNDESRVAVDGDTYDAGHPGAPPR